MQTLRSIDPLSAAKVWACVSFAVTMVTTALGLVIHTLFSGGGGMSFGLLSPNPVMVGWPGFGELLMLLILGPLMAAAIGFVQGLVGGYVYNVVADAVGGLKIRIDEGDGAGA